MLYDTRWDKQLTKADPFSLEGLIEWLEKQPADQAYDWRNCLGECMIDQYGASLGIQYLAANADGGLLRIFGDHNIYGIVCSSTSGPTTFGAALKRARAVLAST